MFFLSSLLVLLFLAGCSGKMPSSASMNPALPENPLASCPSSPNCVRETRLFPVSPDTLFEDARAALDKIGAADITATADSLRLDAVFKVFFFKDDVAVLVVPHKDSTALHIRSASRLGHSDLGVNRRRVQHFFEALTARL